ncbi:hypothetical protein [Sphingobacterium lactis]|uniref:hypothetical protein n=1 Tax=Sphingobacterium lactis TaxID=797291 RepID=UPI003DA64883
MNRFMQGKRKGKKAFVILAIIVLFSLLIALLQYLWNTLITDIFSLRAISCWEALGLFAISKILFGRGPGRPGGFGKARRRMERRIAERDDLSEEERERLRTEWKKRFGACGFRD